MVCDFLFDLLKKKRSTIWGNCRFLKQQILSFLCWPPLQKQSEMKMAKLLPLSVQGSKFTVASSKFATWKSLFPPVKNVGSKKLLPGNFCYESNFLEKQADFHWNNSVYKSKHNSIWSKALPMPLTICKFVWSKIWQWVETGLLPVHH